MVTDSFRILSVDDFEPWCRFIRATLQKQRELRVIGEVTDGLEAVQKAQELRPDLTLLDGRPHPNGSAGRAQNSPPTITPEQERASGAESEAVTARTFINFTRRRL